MMKLDDTTKLAMAIHDELRRRDLPENAVEIAFMVYFEFHLWPLVNLRDEKHDVLGRYVSPLTDAITLTAEKALSLLPVDELARARVLIDMWDVPDYDPDVPEMIAATERLRLATAELPFFNALAASGPPRYGF
jgi:hypothetical protein